MEKLVITKPIWFLVKATREDSTQILHDKNPGNFIIRGSRHRDTLALSIKLGASQSFEVHHFIILTGEGRAWLENSELKFDSIVSLAFHYSHVCDELPEVLRLPDILLTAECHQYLASLALLEKAFWSYPMAKPGRRSLLLSENKNPSKPKEDNNYPSKSQSFVSSTSSSISISDNQTSRLKASVQNSTKVISTPPKPPMRSSLRIKGSTSSPPMPQSPPRTRRKSESLKVISEDQTNTKLQRHSVAKMSLTEDYNKISMAKQLNQQTWVSSPMFSQGQVSEKRTRKESVFCSNYEVEKENNQETYLCDRYDTTMNNTNLINVQHNRIEKEKFPSVQSEDTKPLVESDRKEDPDYAEPLDNVFQATNDNSYTDQEHPRRVWRSDENICKKNMVSLRKHRLSDSNIRYVNDGENTRTFKETKERRTSKKNKHSINIFLRRLSNMTENNAIPDEMKCSKQERRLSSMIGNIMTPNLISKRMTGESCQVDSSSWEYLNKDGKELQDKRNKDDNEHMEVKSLRAEFDPSTTIQSSSSKDSVYESEFDSTSTIESQVTSLPKSNKEDALLNLIHRKDYSDQVTKPTTLTYCNKSNDDIESCIRDLATNTDTLFGHLLQLFVKCTVECAVRDSIMVMSNMRQFMTGLKNYLLRTGEGQLHQVIEQERTNLQPHQFLNIDTAIEQAMHLVVIEPLMGLLGQLFDESEESHYNLKENIKYAFTKASSCFHIPKVPLASLNDLINQCKESYTRLKGSVSPTEKLKHYLDMVKQIIFHLSPSGSSLDLASFCSSLMFILVRIEADNVAREAEMMWRLMDPNLLKGEAGYFLTLLYSAVTPLRNIKECFGEEKELENVETTKILENSLNNSTACILPVLFPNEKTGSLVQQCVPMRPGMTVRDVMTIINSRMSARDIDELCMFCIVRGKETKLNASVELTDVLNNEPNSVFICRRESSKILLPFL